ncbi:MAG: hypothetical protein N2440_03785 [Actinobacteria bacterium]|nr:hypothetical protein [Actinomycetota bacterium]
MTDYCSLSELREIRNLDSLEREFDGAIVSYRSGAPLYNQEVSSVYASLNAGDRIHLPENLISGIGNAEEETSDSSATYGRIYRWLIGKDYRDRILFPGINAANNFLESQNSLKLGKFGDLLKSAGIGRYVFGNADLEYRQPDRGFALFLTDSQGVIGKGDVSKDLLKKDMDFPYGLAADYDEIYRRVKETIKQTKLRRKSAVVLVYPGDIKRIEIFQTSYNKERFQRIKKETIEKNIDLLLRIARELSRDDLIVFSSVSPNVKDLKAGSVSGFIFVRGDNYSGGRFLTSQTTKKEGCVFLNDVSYTLARYLGLSTEDLKGNRIETTDKKLEIDELLRIHDELLNVDKFRAPVLKFYVFLIVAALFAAVLNLMLKSITGIMKITKILVYSSAVFPIYMFILGPFIAKQPVLFLFLLFLLSFSTGIVLGALRLRAPIAVAYLLSAFTALIAFDAPFSFFNRFSILGYSFNTGARFYGIGNEHMGIYAAGVYLILSVLDEKYKRNKEKGKDGRFLRFLAHAAIIFASFLWMLLPFAGANVGGAIAVLFGAIITSYYSIARKFDGKLILYILLAGFILLSCFLLVTLFFPSFHLAKFFKSLMESQYDSALTILIRKAELNLKLLWYTVWNKYLLAILASLLFIITNPNEVLSRFFKKDAWGESLLAGTAFGAVAAFAFNDSGVVAAATMLIYPMMIFVSELLEIKAEKVS